jgi:hypothetical protein
MAIRGVTPTPADIITKGLVCNVQTEASLRLSDLKDSAGGDFGMQPPRATPWIRRIQPRLYFDPLYGDAKVRKSGAVGKAVDASRMDTGYPSRDKLPRLKPIRSKTVHRFENKGPNGRGLFDDTSHPVWTKLLLKRRT